MFYLLEVGVDWSTAVSLTAVHTIFHTYPRNMMDQYTALMQFLSWSDLTRKRIIPDMPYSRSAEQTGLLKMDSRWS
jgi:hypothetical protein